VNGCGHVIIVDRLLVEDRHATKEADRATFAELERVEGHPARPVLPAHDEIGHGIAIRADNARPVDIAACDRVVGLKSHGVRHDVEAGEQSCLVTGSSGLFGISPV
jgi:hypothetical protein